ncbi:BfmA/BtgA family mobilization protein [Hymenobacter coccineus]|uniref:Uncharacterized protein n=1 Tax=Hymenobacter coccineus TaxID=1908235 RepID=A0A1G1TMW1_9BACT|nr:BfmA/BtgA family mobilization protein [Hymenobacter coccineus]OGX92206.1 hypothetical protein BEN49_16845 [Hymenobacter coccineus]
MTSKVKTIAADEPAYDAFRQLAKEYQLSNPELLAAMVQYFRVTKADPREPTGPDLTSSLAMLGEKIDKLNKATIGFIREQEKTFLKPILAQVQAHQVLSTPASSTPDGLSESQEEDMMRWLVRVLSKGMLPDQLNPEFLGDAPAMGASINPEDPALALLKSKLLAIVQLAFRPELMIPAMRAKPKPPTPTPPSQPA